MAVAYSRYKFVTVSLPKRLRMAGLGTQNQKSVAPLVRRVQLRSAYNFLCLLYAKWSTRNKNGPHGVSHSPPVIQFDGPNFLFNVTPQYKNQVKISAATLFWPYMPNPAITSVLMPQQTPGFLGSFNSGF